MIKRIAALVLWPLAVFGQAEPLTAAMPAARGVQIEKPAGDHLHFSEGSGVFLGGGLVLTAAHVVTVNAGDPAVSVILDGWKIDSKVASIGINGLDLALLRVDPSTLSIQRQNQPAQAICPSDAAPNQPVAVASEGKVTLSKTVNAPIRSDNFNGDWTDVLDGGYHHGASGGGVFDAQRGCLLGVLTLEASRPAGSYGPALDFTRFVPASKIAPFLEDYRHQNKQ